MNERDDIQPYRDLPPNWFSIGCLVIVIAAIGLIVFFLVKKFGG